ncbi:heparan-alpha-glucosaminide N-acetyltransferase domain-containing protein [Comamonas thiooxydans]|nr:heparan-alpha-glucosaminide N-acetyltransferase domain-containing protein [Comamonas thiooxydans]
MSPSPFSLASAGRLQSIDALRGLVMLFMLLDHVRETFYLHLQVPDPMVVADTAPGLFFPRMLAHLCAPVFVFLTGLGAYLYASRHAEAGQASAASGFLWRRGLFLVLLEVTVVNFAWTFQFPPAKIFLQVIWAIGLSMLALSVLVWLPRKALLLLGLVLVAGHNLFDSLHFPADHVMHIPWAILHDRGWLELAGLQLRTSYPLLPWIGVIALGYGIGPWFGKACDPARRRHHLLVAGISCLLGFALLRTLNLYGDAPWLAGADTLRTVMSWFNVTKYPPSLLFLLLTLGIGLLLLGAFEKAAGRRWLLLLATLGAAPMFFYVLHLYVLKFMYLSAMAVWGANQGQLFGLSSLLWLWVISALLAVTLYPVVRWFAAFKQRRRDITWLKYL